MKWKSAFLFLPFSFTLLLGAAEFLRFAIAANIVTTVVATPAVTAVTELQYRSYNDADSLNPGAPLAAESTPADTPSQGSEFRLRMNLAAAGLALPAGSLFTLQYANASSGPWTDVSTSTAWTFLDNPSVADGQIIVTTLLSSSTVGESYGESNPSAASPSQLLPGDAGEWDWSLLNNAADTSLDWFFRMEYASGTALDAYAAYPEFTGVASPVVNSNPPHVSVGGGAGSYASPSFVSSTPSGTPSSSLPISPPLIPPAFQRADFNGDNLVDIIDLSILLYHYYQTGQEDARYDLSNNGIVDFPDVSILMYYWTE